jgi:glutamyl-tRNA synthetase
MTVITRFAPSPTGFLHVGNIRTAIVNWLFTKQNSGKFFLRIDDTDQVRSKKEFIDQIQADLKWLGIDYDFVFSQSDRFARYEEIKELLIADGKLYPCFETQEELEVKRKILLNRGRPPIYDRSALQLTKEQIAEYIQQGKQPHYRLKLDHESIEWNDLVRGKIHFEGKNLSDPILIREDGSMTYMISSVIDDIDYNVTHIVRGEDHITNTAISIILIKALSGNIPTYAHLSLLKSHDTGISKRDGGFDIKSMKQDGMLPIAIISYLQSLGTSKSLEISNDLNNLVANFDFNNFGKSPAIYDYEDVVRVNQKFLHELSYDEISIFLKNLDFDVDQQFWEFVKANISKLTDLKEWWLICNTAITPAIEDCDQEFLSAAAKILPSNKLDVNSWSEWTTQIKKDLGRSGKTLFLPIRKALTGYDYGPEMKLLLPLIDRDKIINRLNGNKA